MKRKRLPPLPSSIRSPSGPVPVRRRAGLRDGDHPVWGLWDPDSRTIWIDDRLGLEAAWSTLLHERTHAWLADSGVQFPATKAGNDLLELVCDTVSHCSMQLLWERGLNTT